VAETWRDKWSMIEVRWNTCFAECFDGYERVDGNPNQLRSLPPSVQRRDHAEQARLCKAAIEAMAQDLWALRDWLVQDPSTPLTREDLDAFIESADAFHIRSCADLATRVKHFQVDDRRRHLLTLEQVDDYEVEPPTLFRATRIYQGPRVDGSRTPTGDVDEYPDAIEMLRRARRDWVGFLRSNGMAPT
jgi:hypothetical protein